jgi:hypothetical protein
VANVCGCRSTHLGSGDGGRPRVGVVGVALVYRSRLHDRGTGGRGGDGRGPGNGSDLWGTQNRRAFPMPYGPDAGGLSRDPAIGGRYDQVAAQGRYRSSSGRSGPAPVGAIPDAGRDDSDPRGDPLQPANAACGCEYRRAVPDGPERPERSGPAPGGMEFKQQMVASGRDAGGGPGDLLRNHRDAGPAGW